MTRLADAPTLRPGLTLLRTPGPRSTAVHRVALETLAATDGVAYWVDARNVASTYTLYDMVDSSRRLRRLRIARAFTAYQHHALVRRVVQRANERTGLLVAPNVTALYRDDDVPEYQREAMLDSAVRTLAALAEARDLPALVTVPADVDGDAAAVVAGRADRTITCERTSLGHRFEGPEFETTVYWGDGHWQTTIPYWVDLLGAVNDGFGAPGVAGDLTDGPRPDADATETDPRDAVEG